MPEVDQLANQEAAQMLLAANEAVMDHGHEAVHVHTADCGHYHADTFVDRAEGGHPEDCGGCAECAPDQAMEHVDRHHVHNENCGHLHHHEAAQEVDRGIKHDKHVRHTPEHHNETSHRLQTSQEAKSQAEQAIALQQDSISQEIAGSIKQQETEPITVRRTESVSIKKNEESKQQIAANQLKKPAIKRQPRIVAEKVNEMVKPIGEADSVTGKPVEAKASEPKILEKAVIKEAAAEPVPDETALTSDEGLVIVGPIVSKPEILDLGEIAESTSDLRDDTLRQSEFFTEADSQIPAERIDADEVVKEMTEDDATHALPVAPKLLLLETDYIAEVTSANSESVDSNQEADQPVLAAKVAQKIAEQITAIELEEDDSLSELLAKSEKMIASLDTKVRLTKSNEDLPIEIREGLISLLELLGFENARKTLGDYIGRYGNGFLAELLLQLLELRSHAQHNETLQRYGMRGSSPQSTSTTSLGRITLSLLGIIPKMSTALELING